MGYVSFHESGQWHYTLASSRTSRSAEKVPKHLAVSLERNEIAKGWQHSLRIAVAKSEVILPRDEPADPEIVSIPFHPGYDAIAIDMFIGEADALLIRVDCAFPIAAFKLGDGRQAVLFSRPYQLEQPPSIALAPQIQQAREGLQEGGWTEFPTQIVVFFDTEEDFGYLLHAEIKVDL